MEVPNGYVEVKGFNGKYFVDKTGSVWSTFLGRPMCQKTTGGRWGGYKVVHLCKPEGGMAYPQIHRLVYEAFVGEIKDKMQINHIDGVKWNNNVENLEQVTCSENHLHAFRIGIKSLKGERHNNLKLDQKSADYIRESKEPGVYLAKKFGVVPTMICRIRKGKAWTK